MTTSAPAAASKYDARHKRSVRNYLIDSRFQLKYSGFLVAVAVIISAILGGFLYKTSLAVVDASEKLADESKKVSEVSRMNIKDMGYGDSPELMADFNKESDAHDARLAAQQAAVVRQQKTMLGALVGGLALMVVLIGLLGIYFTHKVAGPIYKMKRLLGEVGEGHLIFHGRLRKGDELQDFFEAFTHMVDRLRARQQREADELGLGIELAKAGGASEESLAKVANVRDEMLRALE